MAAAAAVVGVVAVAVVAGASPDSDVTNLVSELRDAVVRGAPTRAAWAGAATSARVATSARSAARNIMTEL